MTKQELVKEISSRIEGSTQKEASVFLEAFIESVKETVRKGDEINLVGFIKIGVKDVEEKTARNPKTGEEVIVPAHKKVTAKVSKKFIE